MGSAVSRLGGVLVVSAVLSGSVLALAAVSGLPRRDGGGPVAARVASSCVPAGLSLMPDACPTPRVGGDVSVVAILAVSARPDEAAAPIAAPAPLPPAQPVGAAAPVSEADRVATPVVQPTAVAVALPAAPTTAEADPAAIDAAPAGDRMPEAVRPADPRPARVTRAEPPKPARTKAYEPIDVPRQVEPAEAVERPDRVVRVIAIDRVQLAAVPGLASTDIPADKPAGVAAPASAPVEAAPAVEVASNPAAAPVPAEEIVVSGPVGPLVSPGVRAPDVIRVPEQAESRRIEAARDTRPARRDDRILRADASERPTATGRMTREEARALRAEARERRAAERAVRREERRALREQARMQREQMRDERGRGRLYARGDAQTDVYETRRYGSRSGGERVYVQQQPRRQTGGLFGWLAGE